MAMDFRQRNPIIDIAPPPNLKLRIFVIYPASIIPAILGNAVPFSFLQHLRISDAATTVTLPSVGHQPNPPVLGVIPRGGQVDTYLRSGIPCTENGGHVPK